MRLASITLFVLLLSRSAWSQPARIYVYAQRETPARSWLLILCDGAPVAKIKQGTFFAINLDAGRHVLSSSRIAPAFVVVKAGGESFVRLDSQVEIGEPTTLTLENIPHHVARNEMRFVLYIDAKKALSDSVPKSDPRATLLPRLKTRDDRL